MRVGVRNMRKLTRCGVCGSWFVKKQYNSRFCGKYCKNRFPQLRSLRLLGYASSSVYHKIFWVDYIKGCGVSILTSVSRSGDVSFSIGFKR